MIFCPNRKGNTSMETKSWHLRRVRFTREYIFGVMAGLGLGLFTAFSFPNGSVYQVLGRLIGAGFLAIGASLALREQNRCSASLR
jgi:hypothetical protein